MSVGERCATKLHAWLTRRQGVILARHGEPVRRGRVRQEATARQRGMFIA